MPRYFSDGVTLTLDEKSIGDDCRNPETGELNWKALEEMGIKQKVPVVVYDKNLQTNFNNGAQGIHIDQKSIDAIWAEKEAKLRATMKEEMADTVALALAAALKAAGIGKVPTRVVDIKKRRGRPKGVANPPTPTPAAV